MKPEETILICAVRYALGRMTYVVDEVCQYVATKPPELSKNCINIIIRDIEEKMEWHHKSGYMLGMECDEKTWRWLLERLKGSAKWQVLMYWNYLYVFITY
jgi:hypothetical protein